MNNNSKNIEFSIIIPHKNIPDLLIRCVNSIPKSKEFEVIVVDDNSNPNIVNKNYLKQNLKHPNINIYFTKKGGGAGYARNYGIKKATGKWIYCMDADDFLVEDSINIFNKIKRLNDEVICVRIRTVDSETLLPASRDDYTWAYPSEKNKLFSNNILFSCIPCPYASIIRKDFLFNNNIEFEETIVANDVFRSKKVALCAKDIIFLNDCLYVLTDRKNSLTKWDDMICHRLEVVRNSNKYLKDKGHPELTSTVYHALAQIKNQSFAKFVKYFVLVVINNELYDGINEANLCGIKNLRKSMWMLWYPYNLRKRFWKCWNNIFHKSTIKKTNTK